MRRDRERMKRKGLRDEGVKGLRKNLLTQRTQRSERMMEFLFMDEIVTGGVGQMRTYGARGQVKGGRGKNRIFNFGFWIVGRCEWVKGVKGLRG